MSKMKIPEAIARWCQDIEAPFVAGIPGNGMLGVIDELSTKTDVPFVLTRHEQGASMMAYSYAFHSRKPAVAFALKAPGATNTSIGVMGAYLESLPMIVLTCQVSSKHLGYEAFEEMDLVNFFKPITKWSVAVHQPERLMGVLNEAYRRTLSGRPGPVHVSIPYDFMNYEVDGYDSPKVPMNPPISTSVIETFEDVLLDAERPIIIAGGGLPFENAQDVLCIARLLDVPVVQSWLRKPVPDRDPYCVGMAGIGGSPAAQHAIANADAVLVLGCRFSEQMTEHFVMRFNESAKIIHVDIDPAVIGRVFNVHTGIEGDLKEFVPVLRKRLEAIKPAANSKRAAWREKIQSIQNKYITDLKEYKRDEQQPQGRFVVEQLRELLPSDAVMVLDSGNYLHWAEQYFPVPEAGLFHYPTSGTMGFGVPGAIGAKFARKDQFVCALVGDGGFAMTMGEIETAVRLDIPILVVVINNSTLGHIRIRQDTAYGSRHNGVNFGWQDFSYIAKAFGVYGARVDEVANLRSVLEEAINSVKNGTSAIVDVHVSDEMADAPNVHWWPKEEARNGN
jgi:acetolactate synthase-1/2/3 large subunit